MTTVTEVIAAFDTAASNSARGTKFEELMVDYFRFDPTLASQYAHVSRWGDWAHRGSSPDVGIDLVAQDRVTGEWTAVQCKFFAPNHYLRKEDIDSFFTASGKKWNGLGFANRIIISTTDKWSSHAEAALEDQTIPVQRIGLAEIAASPIDWAFADPSRPLEIELAKAAKYKTRPHQDKAIAAIRRGFETSHRGQWISACGTGKTFTSLKLAEEMAADVGGSLRVLFLAPSIQLISQTLREWTAQAQTDLRAFVVCSDTKSSRAAEDISPHDVPLPATTDPQELHDRLSTAKRAGGLSVVFSTYQSIDVVAQAQKLGAPEFDLILCDEAHRTTGVTLVGEDESAFVRVHDNTFLQGGKRLYMTATPRMFGDAVVAKAADHSAVLTSMDDHAVFGPVFHRLGFGEAVEQELLTDYKVMVLVVTEEQMAAPVQAMMADDNVEIPLDDAAKILGCWNTLSKRTHEGDPNPSFPPGSAPMQRAVAFLENIKSSKRVAEAFELVVEATGGADATAQLSCEARHVDGTMNALVRADELAWLKAPIPERHCRILTNARCLSEGVDVPGLDAVMFLSPRNSAVDVVQSVGRVMRKASGKEFGYIILPVAVPVGVDPAQALSDNKRFKVVWDVLNALRAHDDRFEAIIQSINLNGGKDPNGKVIIDTPGSTGDRDSKGTQLPLFQLDQWRDAIYSRIVDRVGTREYWDRWANDVATMSTAQIARIEEILKNSSPEVRDTFDAFLAGLRGNLNEAITRADAISMLSQHLITAPVFDALFGGSGFAASNPVSVGMQAMLDVLEGQGLDAETDHLEKFYKSVRTRAEAVTDAAGRQTVIHDLYEKFFKKAFPKQAEALGIVYTPVEVVDFMLRATDELSRRHFGQGLTDEGVTILDPFTGTGTFIVRLLESGLIKPEDLARKYSSELLANEIMLLAYYIACVNIEATYEALTSSKDYAPFPGAALTDTFQISEHGDRVDTSLLPANNERITKQLDTDITVIIGNPPYSVGQASANDNNRNHSYPTLDARIRDTYAARSSATLKRNLYDSYVRAFRWASDRLGEAGIMAFVSNGGWLDSNSADGLRLVLPEEFSELWILNLRGNQRNAGLESKREGGKIFGSGSRNTVAVILAVKKATPSTMNGSINYREVGDFLSREEKLKICAEASLLDDEWHIVSPGQRGDWLNQRDDAFSQFAPLSERGATDRIFALASNGLLTNRDAWCYNFDPQALSDNVNGMIATYNESLGQEQPEDSRRISWSRSLRKDHSRGEPKNFRQQQVRPGLYRPFMKQAVYFDRSLNEAVGKLPELLPTKSTLNPGIYWGTEPGGVAAIATEIVTDLHLCGSGQFFPRWTYEAAAKRAEAPDMLFDDPDGEVVDGYRRVDNITDSALAEYRKAFGKAIKKHDIFHYVYGLLHSQQYRERFAADLKKMMPRIPLAANPEDFRAFADAGSELMDLHINYETVEPYPLEEVVSPAAGLDDYELFGVTSKKMKFASKTDKSVLLFNPHVTLRGIPDEAHEYQLGSRSALEWIVDRYWIKTDKASGIVNDPNAWSRKVDDPRYIVDLVKRVTTVSVETVKIVRNLPELPLDGA